MIRLFMVKLKKTGLQDCKYKRGRTSSTVNYEIAIDNIVNWQYHSLSSWFNDKYKSTEKNFNEALATIQKTVAKI